MVFKTKNGIVITDEMLDEIADAFERGQWPGTSSRIVKGRPLILGEPLKSVTFKDTANELAAMDKRAASLNMSRSDYLRYLIRQDLASAI